MLWGPGLIAMLSARLGLFIYLIGHVPPVHMWSACEAHRGLSLHCRYRDQQHCKLQLMFTLVLLHKVHTHVHTHTHSLGYPV